MLLSELKSQNLESHNFKNVNFDNFDMIFDQIDGNKDGSLSKTELHDWLIQMCSTGTTTVHLEHQPSPIKNEQTLQFNSAKDDFEPSREMNSASFGQTNNDQVGQADFSSFMGAMKTLVN